MGKPNRSYSQRRLLATSAFGPAVIQYQVAGTCCACRSRENCRAQTHLKNNTPGLESNSQEHQGHICKNCSNPDNFMQQQGGRISNRAQLPTSRPGVRARLSCRTPSDGDDPPSRNRAQQVLCDTLLSPPWLSRGNWME